MSTGIGEAVEAVVRLSAVAGWPQAPSSRATPRISAAAVCFEIKKGEFLISFSSFLGSIPFTGSLPPKRVTCLLHSFHLASLSTTYLINGRFAPKPGHRLRPLLHCTGWYDDR